MKPRETSRLHAGETMDMQEQHSGPANSVDLPYLLSVLASNLRLIVLVVIVCVAAMYAYLSTVAPTYRASSKVILDTREETVSPVTAVVSDLDISNPVVAGEVVTIQSNLLLGRVVDRLNLLSHPELDPRVERPEAPIAWLRRLVRGDPPPHVMAQSYSPEVLRDVVLAHLAEGLTVRQEGIAFAIEILFEAKSPVLAAEVANTIADEYIVSQLEEKLAVSSRANDWLADRLEELSQQVEEAGSAVVEFRANMIEKAGGNEDSISQLLAELNTRLVESSTERADAEIRMSQVEALLEVNGLSAVADVVTSPLLETLLRQRAELEARQAQLGSSLGPKHPEMVQLSAQIGDLDRSIEKDLKRRIEEMRSEVVVTRNREEALLQQIAGVSARADILARQSVRLSQLERSAEAARIVYGNFLTRYKETSAQADFQTPEARVVNRAQIPLAPSSPRKTLMLLAAFGFGLSGATAFVFLRNLAQAPVMNLREVQSITNLPVLGMLPRIRHFGGRFDWFRKAMMDPKWSNFMDHVNSLRTALQLGPKSSGARVILVTSSLPNESKTTLSCALAKSVLNGGASVVLVDADLRRPDVRKTLGMPQDGGCLIQYIERKLKLKDLIIRSELTGFDVVSSTQSSSHAADLLSANIVSGLFTRLSSQYDFVIVNGPPVLYLSDTVLLAKEADATIMVVRSGRTPAKNLRNSVRRLENAGVSIAGTVLTMVQKSHPAAGDFDMYQNDY